MGGYGESFLGKKGRKRIRLRVEKYIIDRLTLLANKMVVVPNERIEMLRAADG